MSFPASPVDGQLATVNNITYVYNSVNNAWRRQILTDLAFTGNVVASGNVVATGNVVAGNYFYSNGAPFFTTITEYNAINGDGVTTQFTARYQQDTVTLLNPWNYFVTIDGILQTAFEADTDLVWLSHAFCASTGYTISSGRLKFPIPPAAGSLILVRTQLGSAPTTARIYPFKPLDIALGI
jgi:hypothetical protein